MRETDCAYASVGIRLSSIKISEDYELKAAAGIASFYSLERLLEQSLVGHRARPLRQMELTAIIGFTRIGETESCTADPVTGTFRDLDG